MKNIAYDALEAECNVGFKVSHTTAQNNMRVLRAVMADWAREKIQLGTRRDWDRAKRHVPCDRALAKANIWADTTDFPTERRRDLEHSVADYSAKLQHWGVRYMIWFNARARAIYASTAYTPKMDDRQWWDVSSSWVEILCPGAGFIGDKHAYPTHACPNDVLFFVPYASNAKNLRMPDGHRVAKTLTWKRDWNRKVYALERRVERPFGQIKRKFQCLQVPWREPLEQLDYVVKIALAIYNMRRTA
jgi:hypothetical protein